MVTIAEVQKQQREWALRNFGSEQSSTLSFLGIVEELAEWAKASDDHELIGMTMLVGTLAHAHLKSEQGIRTTEPHEADAKDAIADMFIFMCDYCSRRGWDLEDIIWSTWNKVKQRNWKENPSGK